MSCGSRGGYLARPSGKDQRGCTAHRHHSSAACNASLEKSAPAGTRFGPQASVFDQGPSTRRSERSSKPAPQLRQGAGSTKDRGDEDEHQNDAYRMNRHGAKFRDDSRCSFVPLPISPFRTFVRRSTRRRRLVPRLSGTGAGTRRPRTDMQTGSP
jgi:hypothetical protein